MSRTIASGTATATGAQASFYPVGRSRTGVRREAVWVALSGGVGDMSIEAQLDGTNWSTVQAAQTVSAVIKLGTRITNMLRNIPCRINVTAYTSGTLAWSVITE